jgi:hypothetical protein
MWRLFLHQELQFLSHPPRRLRTVMKHRRRRHHQYLLYPHLAQYRYQLKHQRRRRRARPRLSPLAPLNRRRRHHKQPNYQNLL